MYIALLFVHKITVVLSIIGFVARGWGHIFGKNWVSKKLVKIAPHIVDTLLIVSAISLVFVTGFKFTDTWIIAKILGLIGYIVLGLMAFRFAKDRLSKAIYWLAALIVIFYVVAVAMHKTPFPF